jgi:hypothetical protein
MAGSQAFEWLCAALEASSSLSRLEARGTVRIALKEAGLEARSVSAHELTVVVRKVLPRELRQRGVSEEDTLCDRFAAGLTHLEQSAPDGPDTPDAIFRRLGGGS